MLPMFYGSNSSRGQKHARNKIKSYWDEYFIWHPFAVSKKKILFNKAFRIKKKKEEIMKSSNLLDRHCLVANKVDNKSSCHGARTARMARIHRVLVTYEEDLLHFTYSLRSMDKIRARTFKLYVKCLVREMHVACLLDN